MKQCPNCGNYSADTAAFCESCGTALPAAGYTQVSYPAADAYYQQPQAQLAADKQAFLELPENAKMKKELKAAAILCYICAGITCVLMVLMAKNYLSLVDVALLIGLGLGVHLRQSRACAIVLCAYAVINTVISLVTTGTPGGWLVIIAGVFAVIYTFKLDKAWKAYQQQHGLQ